MLGLLSSCIPSLLSPDFIWKRENTCLKFFSKATLQRMSRTPHTKKLFCFSSGLLFRRSGFDRGETVQNWHIEHGVKYVKNKMSQNSLIASGYFANVFVSIFLKVDINTWSSQFSRHFLFSSTKEWLFWFSTFSCRKDFGELYVAGVDGFFFGGRMRDAYLSSKLSGL